MPRWKAGDFAQEIQDIPLPLSHPQRQDFGISETKHRQIHPKCVHQKPGKSRQIAKILTVRFRSCYTSIFVVLPLPIAPPCSSIPPSNVSTASRSAPRPSRKVLRTNVPTSRSNGEKDLLELAGKSVLLPKDPAFHPDAEGLEWGFRKMSA